MAGTAALPGLFSASLVLTLVAAPLVGAAVNRDGRSRCAPARRGTQVTTGNLPTSLRTAAIIALCICWAHGECTSPASTIFSC